MNLILNLKYVCHIGQSKSKIMMSNTQVLNNLINNKLKIPNIRIKKIMGNPFVSS